ncbi:hypothetical protein GCM10027287_03200 [Bordetella muralis]
MAALGRLGVERGKPKERSDEVDEAVSAAQAADRCREAPTRPLPHINVQKNSNARLEAASADPKPANRRHQQLRLTTEREEIEFKQPTIPAASDKSSDSAL